MPHKFRTHPDCLKCCIDPKVGGIIVGQWIAPRKLNPQKLRDASREAAPSTMGGTLERSQWQSDSMTM